MIIIRNKYISFILEKKYVFLCIFSFLSLVILMIIALIHGSETLSLNNIHHIFSRSSPFNFIFLELRLPRILGACIGGGLLAVSGSMIQAVIKNPLASPDIIGVSSGGTIGAFIYFLCLQSFLPYYTLPIFTFIGSSLSLYFLLLFLKKSLTTLHIILTGLALNTLLGAIITGLMLFSNEFTGTTLYTWSIGSTYGISIYNVGIMSLGIILFLCLLPILSRLLTVHSISDDLVINLGGNLNKEKKALLTLAVVFSSLSVSYLGIVSFIGLIAPHCAKKLIPNNYQLQLIISLLIGAIITVGADLLARTINIPYEYPLGVFTTLLGAPYFLYIIFATKTRIS